MMKMKNLLLISLLALLCMPTVFGQQQFTIVAKGETTLEGALPHDMLYAFDEFRDATIFNEDGSRNDIRININLISKDVLFLTKSNQLLLLAYPDQVDSILVGEELWIPVDGTFGEVVGKSDDTFLLRLKQTKITDSRKEGGFGISSSTSSVTSVTSFVSDAGAIGAPLAVGEYDFETKVSLKLTNGKQSFFADKKGFIKAFPEKKKEIDAFLKSNPVDFKNDAAVINFFKKCLSF
jgi:hypothetical protein